MDGQTDSYPYLALCFTGTTKGIIAIYPLHCKGIYRIYIYCPVVTEKSTNPSVKLTLSMPRLPEAWTS